MTVVVFTVTDEDSQNIEVTDKAIESLQVNGQVNTLTFDDESVLVITHTDLSTYGIKQGDLITVTKAAAPQDTYVLTKKDPVAPKRKMSASSKSSPMRGFEISNRR